MGSDSATTLRVVIGCRMAELTCRDVPQEESELYASGSGGARPDHVSARASGERREATEDEGRPPDAREPDETPARARGVDRVVLQGRPAHSLGRTAAVRRSCLR